MLLLLPALVCLVLAALRTWNYMNYRKRHKSRKNQTLDILTLGLYLAAAVLLVLAFLPGPGPEVPPVTEPSGTTDPDPTETVNPSGSTTHPTEPDHTTAPANPTDPRSGWVEEDGKRFYVKEDGTRAPGWLDLDGKRYYFDENGYTLSGWKGVEGIVRYFRRDGSMARGEETINGTRYYFDSTGAEILVANPWNYIPEGYEVELTGMSSYYATEGVQVASHIYADLIQMMDDCNAYSGSRCCVISGFRTHEYQTQAYEETVWELLYLGGKTEDEARAEAATRVAIPGTSEHQLGLAADIIDTELWALDQEQENLPAQKWLMAHCWEYGFILRYPNGKTDVTGIIYEPWHYRYVGRELAKEITDLGLTLEEYLDSLD